MADQSSAVLAAAITAAANKQTYTIIRFLVDRDRVADAFRAYGYFRWLDDQLDQGQWAKPVRLALLERQKEIWAGRYPGDVTAEERMLVDLMESDPDRESGLQVYIANMMAVMTFDAERKGRPISQAELTNYTRCLSTAVTEALHYFIGHEDHPPRSGRGSRYLAVTAAHIAHMLRDTQEDLVAGYFNIPCGFLESYGLTPGDVESEPYRRWVAGRVRQARVYLKLGRNYLAQVKNSRCRLAGTIYAARFERVLATIERSGYRL